MKRSEFWLGAVVCIWAGVAHSQVYPVKPIRIVVLSAPGGANDFMARLIGPRLSESLGQSVIVDNRGGAGGNIGADMVAKSPADGYTLLLGSTQMTVNPHIYPKMPYDIVKDLYPITLLATSAAVLALHPGVPANSVKDLIAIARAKPGALTYASSGSGSAAHIAAELFKASAGIDMMHVPYRGNGPAYIDLIAGQVDLIFGNKPGAMPHVKAGRLKAIAVTGRTRDPALPDLPTIGESVPGFETSTWWGVFGPAGLPKGIVEKLHVTITKAASAAEVRERMANVGADPASMTPPEFAALVRQELLKHAEIVKRAGLKLE